MSDDIRTIEPSEEASAVAETEERQCCVVVERCCGYVDPCCLPSAYACCC